MCIRMKAEERDRLLKSVMVSVLLSFSFSVFAPISIYLSNISDFWFSIRLILPIVVAVGTFSFVCCFLLIYMAIRRISKENYDKIVAVMLLLTISAFLQGNFIVDKNGALDGSQIDWSAINSSAILSCILWTVFAVGAFCVIFFKRARLVVCNSVSTVFVGLILLQIITLGILIVTKWDYLDKNECQVTTMDEFKLSSKKNFIILILDTFDAEYMSSMLNDDIERMLEDFTFYPDTLSVFGHTDLSLPQLLTGEEYRNDIPYEIYLKKAFDNSVFLNELIKEKWDVGLYTESEIPQGTVSKETVNCINTTTSISSKRRFIKSFYQLVGYNYMPYHFKKFFWFYPEVFNDMKVINEPDARPFVWSNEVFYHDLDITLQDNSTFKLYHLKGMHGPYNTDENLIPVSEYATREEAIKGNLLLINRFIKELKEKDIFDNSIIIIMADHGDARSGEYVWNQNPLLLIKGIDEKHGFMTSNRKISYSMFSDIYMELMRGKQSNQATEIYGEGTERYFLYYDYNSKDEKADFFPTIFRYSTNSVASDFTKMNDTGIMYKPK